MMMKGNWSYTEAEPVNHIGFDAMLFLPSGSGLGQLFNEDKPLSAGFLLLDEIVLLIIVERDNSQFFRLI